MIYDSLENADLYRNLSPRFAAAFDYLTSERAQTDPPGKHEIDGQQVFAVVQETQTKPIEQCLWEAHRKYADVQYLVKGRERMGVAPIQNMKPTTAYDADNDVGFFEGDGLVLSVDQGMFALFMPHDVHMPCIMVDSPKPVRKVVVKVRVEE